MARGYDRRLYITREAAVDEIARRHRDFVTTFERASA